jgi:hypothetical protein
MLLVLLAPPTLYGDQTVTCREKNGYKAGSVTIKDDGSLIYRDRNGYKTGSGKMRNGKAIFYDKRGYKTGECNGYLPLKPGCIEK